MIFNTGKVSAVTSTLEFTIRSFKHSFHLIIGWISIAKAIWHQQINIIGRSKALALGTLLTTLFDTNEQCTHLFTFCISKGQFVLTYYRIRRDMCSDEEVIRAFQGHRTDDIQRF